MEELLKPAEAARIAGVSYPTLKQWIYKGKVHSVKTAGGHHRVARSEIERFSGVVRARTSRGKPIGIEAISGRNKLRGIVTDIRYEGLLVQVTIDVGGQSITSIITSDATKALGLKKGSSVYALIKATEVMVIRN
ncbi:MAG TPA: helix-turn-helix transcriptional regulator [Pyrinomonadaceae bacterium]|nr:helix-turn-helix transcriptional regulator [Pyrinomonadaceae bacterium]